MSAVAEKNTSGHCKPTVWDLRASKQWHSCHIHCHFLRGQQLASASGAVVLNGVSVKEERAPLPRRRGRPVGAWKRATQPSALIAMKTPPSWVYGVAGGTGALWEVLLSWPQFVLAPDPPWGPREVGCEMDTRWRRNNRDAEQRGGGSILAGCTSPAVLGCTK